MIMYGILKDKKVIHVSFEEFLKEVRSDGFDGLKNRVVQKTKLHSDKVEVSTVFLGINHSFTSNKELWFETLIFGGGFDGYQKRYETWDEAMEGHQRAVELASNEID